MVTMQGAVNSFFQQSAWLQLGVFVLHGLVVLGLSMGFIRLFSRRANVLQWTPVGPYFAALSVIFALFLAFHANSIWVHKSQAERAFIEAGTSIKRMDEMLSPTELDLPEARLQLQRYVKYVFKDEWRTSRNRRPSERADGALRDLQAQVVLASRTVPAPAASQLNSLLNDVARTRSERLWLGSNYTEVVSWLGVLVLGLLTHLAVAAVHFDRPRAGLVALSLLALGTTTAYWTLGLVVDPYRAADQLNPFTWIAFSLQ
jgi:hypothetical protein